MWAYIRFWDRTSTTTSLISASTTPKCILFKQMFPVRGSCSFRAAFASSNLWFLHVLQTIIREHKLSIARDVHSKCRIAHTPHMSQTRVGVKQPLLTRLRHVQWPTQLHMHIKMLGFSDIKSHLVKIQRQNLKVNLHSYHIFPKNCLDFQLSRQDAFISSSSTS